MPDKEKDPLRPFKEHGVEFTSRSGQSMQSDCPFCGKTRSFHVKPESTQWVCSSSPDTCGRSGNLVTFLEQWLEHCRGETEDRHWAALSKARGGMPASCFKGMGMAFNELTGDWLIPHFNAKGRVCDLRRWRPGGKPRSTSDCQVSLWNLPELLDPKKKDWPVDICEGEFDGGAMRWLNRRIKRKAIVVAVPGARIFKPEWAPYFRNRTVIWRYDNDADGDTYSLKHSVKTLNGVVFKQRFQCWPETYPEKWDVRDHIVKRCIDEEASTATVYAEFKEMIKRQHRRADQAAPEDMRKKEKRPRPKSNPTFEKTVAAFEKAEFKMRPDLVEALWLTYAITLSTQMPGVPLWVFLVGPPGSGKTEILLSLEEVQEVFYRSSVTAKNLVSGFKLGANGEDPSDIPNMLGMCCVYKDWTEILGLNPFDAQQVHGVFRGAYDGLIQRKFGNGEYREYRGFFNILAGVTNRIHGESNATMGERFLKFQLKDMGFSQRQSLYYAIIMGAGHELEKAKRMKAASLAFLDRDVSACEAREMMPEWAALRLGGLAEIVATLRHEVEWKRSWSSSGGEDLVYRPVSEIGTRLCAQFSKLAMAAAVVRGKKKVDHEVYRLVERVAFDTAIGFNLDVVAAMMEMGGSDLRNVDIAQQSSMSVDMLKRRLRDLALLGVVAPTKAARRAAGPGRPGDEWRVSRTMRQLWSIAKPFDLHLDSAAAGREKP